jgi:integrase/recombinase XerD
MAKGVRDATVHGYARSARRFLNFLVEEEYRSRPVKVSMPRVSKRRMKILKPDEFMVLVDACKSDRDRALILFLVDSGMRRSEAAALEWTDLDIANGTIHVRSETSKGRKHRVVIVGSRTRRALLKLRRTRRDETSVFGLKPSGLRQALRRLGERTEIKFSPHTLRRTFAVWSIRAGASLFHVQMQLGHEDLAMVRRYAQLVEDDLRDAFERHGPVDTLLK